jgi:NAD(P)-dependent dehydrogenase (short-subunit alcohol dehydrogenase family)
MPAPSHPIQPYADRYLDHTTGDDARPTALEIVEDLKLKDKLQDKVILITGTSAGLGLETARALHLTGAKLFLTYRNQAKGEAIINELVASNPKGQHPTLIEMELSSLESVRQGAKQFLDQSKRLDILINNAGIMAVPEGRTVDGFEMQIGTNHFSHFLLFQLLKPVLLASGSPGSPSRVITLSSAAHKASRIFFDDLDLSKQGYSPLTAYAQSKTANLYMANSIDRHYGSQNLRGLSVHPGLILTTELARHVSDEEKQFFAQMAHVARSSEQGAATTVWAALSPTFNDHGGVYLADVGESDVAAEDEVLVGPGYVPHAYDEEAEEKLWKLSYEAVGLKDVDQ